MFYTLQPGQIMTKKNIVIKCVKLFLNMFSMTSSFYEPRTNFWRDAPCFIWVMDKRSFLLRDQELSSSSCPSLQGKGVMDHCVPWSTVTPKAVWSTFTDDTIMLLALFITIHSSMSIESSRHHRMHVKNTVLLSIGTCDWKVCFKMIFSLLSKYDKFPNTTLTT